jgi:hypothetical protein
MWHQLRQLCRDLGHHWHIGSESIRSRPHPHISTMNTTYSDFAATLAEIRTALTDLAFDKDKADRAVMMRAAAAIAMFESDTLRKAAGPILPGELQA